VHLKKTPEKNTRNIFPILHMSKILSHNGKSIGPSKISKCSPLKCLKFGTDVPNLEDLSRSNGAAICLCLAGRNVEKTKWRGGPQVLEVYEVLIIVAYC
jgi:hypothetical protein